MRRRTGRFAHRPRVALNFSLSMPATLRGVAVRFSYSTYAQPPSREIGAGSGCCAPLRGACSSVSLLAGCRDREAKVAEILGIGCTHRPVMLRKNEEWAFMMKASLADPDMPEKMKNPASWPEGV